MISYMCVCFVDQVTSRKPRSIIPSGTRMFEKLKDCLEYANRNENDTESVLLY